MKSDYKDNASQKVLQKIEVKNDSAPFGTFKLTVTVSEYRVQRDFFDEIPPDDERMCIRKFVLSSVDQIIPKFTLEYFHNSHTIRKKLVLTSKATGLDRVLKILPDLKVGEAEAAEVFKLFHNEMWKINDGFLSQALEEAEQDLEKIQFKARVARKTETRDLAKVDEKLIEEGSMDIEPEKNTFKESEDDTVEALKQLDDGTNKLNEEEKSDKETDAGAKKVVTREVFEKGHVDNQARVARKTETGVLANQTRDEDEEVNDDEYQEKLITEDELWERR